MNIKMTSNAKIVSQRKSIIEAINIVEEEQNNNDEIEEDSKKENNKKNKKNERIENCF